MDCADYSLGAIVMLLGFLVFISAQVMRIFSDLFLIEWAEESSANSKNWLLFYRYLVVLGILLLLNLLRMGYLNAVVATCSKNIHRLVLQNVMAASVPMFFDTHAVGEVRQQF